MQAYLAMKGPGADMQDPLVNWIGKQEVDKQENGEPTWVASPRVFDAFSFKTNQLPIYLSLLGGVEDSINARGDWKVRGPATFEDEDEERAAIFCYVRPSMNHITIDKGFDPDKVEEMHLGFDKMGDGWAKYAVSEVSDDGEGDPADSRLSPCTFARWAHGSKRWDEPGDKYKSMWEERETYEIPVSQELLRAHLSTISSTPSQLYEKVYYTDARTTERPTAPRFSKHRFTTTTKDA